MARYTLRRKTFGIIGSAAGGVLEGTGKVAGNGLVSTAVGGLGGAKAGSAIGSMFGPMGTLIGGIAGAVAGKKGMQAMGDSMQQKGQEMKAGL